MSEEHLKKWDGWRKYIAEGGTASWPRDEFEILIENQEPFGWIWFSADLSIKFTPFEAFIPASYKAVAKPLYTHPHIPDGYQLVPVEPTFKMLLAMIEEWDSGGKRTAEDNYKAMLKVAKEG